MPHCIGVICDRYERRFVELYEQVAGTTDETKKYYTMYNTLQNTKDFIVKESKVMDRQEPTSSCNSGVLTLASVFATIFPRKPTKPSSLRAWREF
jgi:hypothetical protein